MLYALDVARVEQRGLGEGRKRTVRGLWDPILRHLGEQRDATRLGLGDVDAYEGARRAEGVSGQTIRREVQALVRGLELAKRGRLIRVMPFDPEEIREIESDEPNARTQAKLWSAKEIAAVLSKLSGKAVKAGIRDQMRLVQLTGLRLSEMKRLRPSWVSGKYLHVPASGTKVITGARSIPLAKEVHQIIKRRSNGDDSPPFARGKPNRALALASSRAKLRAVLTPRDLRAWWITQAGKKDPVAAQLLAGHTSIATTTRYLKADADRMLAAARAAAEAARVPTRRSPQGEKRKKKGQ